MHGNVYNIINYTFKVKVKRVTILTRHQTREMVFILLFESMFNKDSMAEIIETAKECDELEITPQVEEWALSVWGKLEVIDQIVEKHCVKWSMERICKVSLAIVRLATYEIFFTDDIDIGVAINEAVEISKKFSLPDDTSFVNGILGSISKESNKEQ